ncbi:aminoglycoside phosphotransferase family protein [Saccharibacillus sacchari]|uniref:Aminoglycoside phosphotransferase family protein n=1 Tax=Saccharibacillus sacchari TaxID=456493 RepID=A0ACC6PER1_9BACL
MESVTKRRMSEDELQRIAHANFGCGCTHTQELGEGWANSAYVLQLEDGRSAVLKAAAESEEGRMRCERGLMRTEVDVMRKATSLGTVPLPEIYAYDASKSIVPCEYFLMEKLSGVSYDKVREEMPGQEKETVDRELGGYFRQIHTITGTQFGYYLPNPVNSAAWDEAFIGLMRDVMQDGRDAGIELPMGYGDLDAKLQQHRDALREVKTPRLIHWDSWAGNVFVQNGQVESLIDFERALWADPLMEYGFGKFAYSPAFEQGYGEEDARIRIGAATIGADSQVATLPEGSEHSQKVRRALYPLYLDLVMRVECHYRGFGEEHTQWAHANLKDGWERFLTATQDC